MTAPSVAISLESVSIVFGGAPEKALPLMDDGIEREEVKEKTGQVLGVHDCSLEVNAGEIVVLMGLSGSGKSTLLRAVNRLNIPIRGRVLVDGGDDLVDICQINEESLRFFRTRRIAMVFQQFALLPWRTVLDNVAFGLEVAGVPVEERRQQAMSQLKEVNLEGWENCRINELSGGMQQRVGLARALATNAPILLMDEPFSALDPLIRLRLQDELLRLQAQLNRTILFVTHDLDEALKLGNRIVIMQGGRIVQMGRPEDIVARPKTPYVADFIAQMNPLKTLRVHSLMRPLQAGEAPTGARLPGFALLSEAVAMRHEGAELIFVEGDDGEVKGCLGEREISAALVGRIERRAD